MNHNGLRFILIIVIIVVSIPAGMGQTTMPEILEKGTLPEQMNYLQEKTRIYEFYRAIREDMFQKIKKNALDSLSSAKKEIAKLIILSTQLNSTIDSLNSSLETTNNKLDEVTRTKNSIRVLGMEINKFVYNSFMWILVAGLATLLVMGFLVFQRNLIVTKNIRKDLNDLKAEFEAFRKSSREAREKMSMDHFNELKRLRGK
jgi:predicted  nucleic acid-binding Zn-ribbon protein